MPIVLRESKEFEECYLGYQTSYLKQSLFAKQETKSNLNTFRLSFASNRKIREKVDRKHIYEGYKEVRELEESFRENELVYSLET